MVNGYSNITTETELSELRRRGRGGQTDLDPMRLEEQACCISVSFWAVYCEPALRTQVWLAICMMGVAVVPTGMLTSRKAWVWGTETGPFWAICMENETESKLFLHAYCYANGSDSSVSVSIS